MPYVVRDAAGRIVKLLAEKSPETSEELQPGDPALLEFLARTRHSAGLQNALAASDLGEIVADTDEMALP